MCSPFILPEHDKNKIALIRIKTCMDFLLHLHVFASYIQFVLCTIVYKQKKYLKLKKTYTVGCQISTNAKLVQKIILSKCSSSHSFTFLICILATVDIVFHDFDNGNV